jgi:hypothetical protein
MSELSWDIDDPKSMIVGIKQDGKIVMKISIAEIIESSSRKSVLNHVAECDRTPWLTRWQNERHEVIVDLLKKDYS